MENNAGERQARDAFAWQQTRRKPNGHFNLPTTGFGPLGNYTLWLPSPRPQVQWKFQEGRAVSVPVPSCLDTPLILQLRDRVLTSAVSVGPQLWEVDRCFLDYAAQVILLNYNCTDEDLTFILSGDRWMPAMLRHCLGGDGVAELLHSIDPDFLNRLFPQPEPSPAPTPTPQRHPVAGLPNKRRWWSRLMGVSR